MLVQETQGLPAEHANEWTASWTSNPGLERMINKT